MFGHIDMIIFTVFLLFTLMKISFSWEKNKECKQFSKLSYESVQAMPLLPKIYPLKIEMKRCIKPNPLIVGGENAVYGEFPHMAAVGYRQNFSVEWLCGGSLITSRFVLTAAHCGQTKWGKPDLVRLGALKIDSGMYIDIDVEKTIIHPDYTPPEVYNDVALLQLKHGVTFNHNLRPACLSTVQNLTTLLREPVVTATGWGHVTFGGVSSPNLLKVSLRIIPTEECQKHYSREKHLPRGINENMICAIGHKHLTDDTCQGDSGGPLQKSVDGNECIQHVIGITSFGKYCGSGSPAIYVKVASFLPWIETIIDEEA